MKEVLSYAQYSEVICIRKLKAIKQFAVALPNQHLQ